MIPDDVLDELRRHAFGIAYRMLGSVGDAEDVAQEAVLRLVQVTEPVAVPAAWTTTVATRLSIDQLRRLQVRRQHYVGPWLPDPLLDLPDPQPGPADRAESAESLSQAFLVLLERLTPAERAAFLLREVFGEGYVRIAEVLERSEAACRQLVSRARSHVQAGRPRFDADPVAGRALLQRFLAAAEHGDVDRLADLLARDVVLYGDGGGVAPSPVEPVRGAAQVAAFLVYVAVQRRGLGTFDLEYATVNGQPGRLLRSAGGPVWDVLTIDVRDGRVQAVRVIRNPVKTAHLDRVTAAPGRPSDTSAAPRRDNQEASDDPAPDPAPPRRSGGGADR